MLPIRQWKQLTIRIPKKGGGEERGWGIYTLSLKHKKDKEKRNH